MAPLKSALRFPSRAAVPPPTAELPPIPFDFTTPPPASRQLTSRFSAETLIVKSPPLLQRMRAFTQDPSPPSSPLRSTRLGHAASASESRINILNPGAFDSDAGSGDEEVLSPRATKSASGGDRWGVGAAREVFEALGGGKRHGRSGSGQSGNSVESAVDRTAGPTRRRASRSFSQPSVSAKGLNPPPRPRRVGTAPPKRPLPSAPRTTSPSPPPSSQAVVLPPRSDSRNACLTYKPPSTRPQSPPSASVPPLNILPRPAAAATPPSTPFRALLVQPPSTHAVRTRSPGSHLVSINVGGTTFVTSLETLTRPDRGGKLGEFVEAVVEEVKGEAEKKDRETARKAAAQRDPSLYSSSDDGESILNSSHFAISPYPSPFPYSHYDHHAELDRTSLDLERIPISPSSPVDPFAQKLFLPLPSFAQPPPPLVNRQQAQLVHSPVPHMRIKSVHPDIVPSPTTPRPPRPSSLDSTASCPNLRLRAQSQSSTVEINPFERALGPFFEVLHGQQRESDSGRAGQPTSVERQSMGVPRDIGDRSAEDQSRSTMLGVPRGSVRRTKGSRSARKAPELPKLALAEEDETGSRPPSLSMSLSTGDGVQVEKEEEREAERNFEVFLDRSADSWTAILTWLRDGVLPPSHSLPRSKRPSSTPDIDSTVLALLSLSPGTAFSLVASLRALTDEASWMGMTGLVEACEVEKDRVAEVVRWLEEECRRKVLSEERERKAEMMRVREKAGWI